MNIDQNGMVDRKKDIPDEELPSGLSGWLVLIAFHLIIMLTICGVSLSILFYKPDL